MPRHRDTRRRKQTCRTRRRQRGGAEHIYTLPIDKLYEHVYEAIMELIDLQIKCKSLCIKKLCGGSNARLCEQTQFVMKHHPMYDFAGSLCHGQIVRITDPTGAQCLNPRTVSNCVCDAAVKKYIEIDKILFDLNKFLNNYHADTPTKKYLESVKNAITNALAFFNNFNIVNELNKVPSDQKTKSINDIMQTPDFKTALRAAIVPPRPISAPSRLGTMPIRASGRRNLLAAAGTVPAAATITESTRESHERILGSITPMTNTTPLP